MINRSFQEEWPDVGAVVKDRLFADHCPVILKVGSNDFGPSPFRFFDHCLTKNGFGEIIKSAWNQGFVEGPPDVVFKEKLKALKPRIKDWRRTDFNRVSGKMEAPKTLFLSLDKLAEERNLSFDERTRWQTAKIEFLKERRLASKDLKQKARIRWAIEGDKNSRFFHATVKAKRNANSIKGLLLNGD